LLSNTLIFASSTSENYTIQPLINKSNVVIKKIIKPLLPPSENRRFAVFACSIHESIRAYTFYTPITAASWQRIGYEAIVVFVGNFSKPDVLTARLNLSRNYLKHVGAHVVDLQCSEAHSVKLSQLVRVFSGFLPDSIVEDEDNILTGDSDLIPLKGTEYKPSPGTNGFIFNAHCCGTFGRRGKNYKMFPSELNSIQNLYLIRMENEIYSFNLFYRQYQIDKIEHLSLTFYDDFQLRITHQETWAFQRSVNRRRSRSTDTPLLKP
jgi:hypothetical protein